MLQSYLDTRMRTVFFRNHVLYAYLLFLLVRFQYCHQIRITSIIDRKPLRFIVLFQRPFQFLVRHFAILHFQSTRLMLRRTENDGERDTDRQTDRQRVRVTGWEWDELRVALRENCCYCWCCCRCSWRPMAMVTSRASSANVSAGCRRRPPRIAAPAPTTHDPGPDGLQRPHASGRRTDTIADSAPFRRCSIWRAPTSKSQISVRFFRGTPKFLNRSKTYTWRTKPKCRRNF